MFAPFATFTVDPPSRISFATWARTSNDNPYVTAGYAVAWDSHSDLGEIVMSPISSSVGWVLKDAEVGRQVYSFEGTFLKGFFEFSPPFYYVLDWPYSSGQTLVLRHRLPLGYYTLSSSTGIIRMPTWGAGLGPFIDSDFDSSHPPAWANG